jgi:hypothetical protein
MSSEKLPNQAKAADALKDAILEYGRAMALEPERLEPLLRSRAPESAQEIAALMAAVSEGLPAAFRRTNQPSPVECSEMVSGLIQRKGLSPELASWTFSTWWSVLSGEATAQKPPGQKTVPASPAPEAATEVPHGFSARVNAGKEAWAKNRAAARAAVALPPKGSPEETELLFRGAREIKSGKPEGAANRSARVIARRLRLKGTDTVVAGLIAQGVPREDARVLVGYALNLKDEGVIFIVGLACCLVTTIISGSLRTPDEVAFAVYLSVIVAVVWAVRRRRRTSKSRELLGQYAGVTRR